MEITQGVNYGKYLVSAYSKKSVSQAEKGNEVKEVSEEEKLAEFKKEIWNELDSYPWNSRVNVSIHITDSAFERMMTDEDFKNRMMTIMYKEASVCRPPIVSSMTHIDEDGYSGVTYNDYDMGKAAFDAHSKDENTFYVKKASHKPDYMELWEERRYERAVRREKLDTEYEKKLYLKQHWERKERAFVAYESNIMEAALQE